MYNKDATMSDVFNLAFANTCSPHLERVYQEGVREGRTMSYFPLTKVLGVKNVLLKKTIAKSTSVLVQMNTDYAGAGDHYECKIDYFDGHCVRPVLYSSADGAQVTVVMPQYDDKLVSNNVTWRKRYASHTMPAAKLAQILNDKIAENIYMLQAYSIYPFNRKPLQMMVEQHRLLMETAAVFAKVTGLKLQKNLPVDLKKQFRHMRKNGIEGVCGMTAFALAGDGGKAATRREKEKNEFSNSTKDFAHTAIAKTIAWPALNN